MVRAGNINSLKPERRSQRSVSRPMIPQRRPQRSMLFSVFNSLFRQLHFLNRLVDLWDR